MTIDKWRPHSGQALVVFDWPSPRGVVSRAAVWRTCQGTGTRMDWGKRNRRGLHLGNWSGHRFGYQNVSELIGAEKRGYSYRDELLILLLFVQYQRNALIYYEIMYDVTRPDESRTRRN